MNHVDGLAKVKGAAIYAADNMPRGVLHAVLAVSSIARGRVAFLDVDAAKEHPGVVDVMTSRNRPSLAIDPDLKQGPFAYRMELLQGDEVRYANQAIAVVIAETLDAATEGAALLAPRYDALPARVDLQAEASFTPPTVGLGIPPVLGTGDVEAGLASAAVRIDAIYETPTQFHNPIEPHSIVAAWDDDGNLSIDMPTQSLMLARGRLAELFGIAPEKIHIRSPFVGGGFGSKGLVGPQVLGVMAAKLVGRPVKLVLRREQMYGPVGHRAATRQRLRIGADAEGHITAISHRTRTASSTFDDFFEPASTICNGLYASPALEISHEAVRLDIGTPFFMRAPGEATGSIALESAIDELAWAARTDPLAFRLDNYAETEPLTGRPFSSKALRECYQVGADRFGWSKRPLQPRQMRTDDGLLMGWGVGTAIFPAHMFFAQARAIIRRNGSGIVETGAHNLGQGAPTALAQIAADSLALDMQDVEFRFGTTDLPDAGLAAGSTQTATAGTAIHNAAGEAIARLSELAASDERSPLYGAGNSGLIARCGKLHRLDDESVSESYADIMARTDLEEVVGHGIGAGDPPGQGALAKYAHGAVFAEVKVDPRSGQVRATRMVGVFAAGRIVNPRLAHSQLRGGMIWGLSFALHEEGLVDRRSGRVLNANLAGYHIPVNADVPPMDVLTVHEDDPHMNVLGVKGVGEVGVTGSAGAIANAVWHATGVRVRRFPIGIEDLLENPSPE